jgi:hypothetical protein
LDSNRYLEATKNILTIVLRNEKILNRLRVVVLCDVPLTVQNDNASFMSLVIQLLKRSPSLETIKLRNCHLQAEELNHLCIEGLENSASSRITNIDLSSNPLAFEDIYFEELDRSAAPSIDLSGFIAYLRRNVQISHLCLNHCEGVMCSDNLGKILDALKGHQNLQVLELDHCDFEREVYDESPLNNTIDLQEKLVSFVRSKASLPIFVTQR